VKAREEVATVTAEMDFRRVRLRGPAMPLELFEVLELCVWENVTFDRLDRPTYEVGL
jgi:hypothetical protein